MSGCATPIWGAPDAADRKPSRGYGAGPVLDGVDLVVASGEVVSVVGRNGSGKSTLIKAVMGLLPEALGKIELDGEALLGLPTHQIARRGVAYVPQGRGIFPRLTVRQNLEIGARAAGVKDGIPGDVLELFPFLEERFAAPCQVASSRCSRSPAHSHRIRACFCSMSRLTACNRVSCRRSASSFPRSRARVGSA
jgi:ABC-type sugar transport system ATPase subunit